MRTSIPRLAVSAALAGSASAMIVTSGSSCSVQCGNSLDATAPSEIVCSQSSMAGSVLETCMNCELTSTAYTTNPNQTDQQWLLYNSRYAISECLWGYPGNTSVSDSPCITSRACGALQTALQYGDFSTSSSIGAYDYCGNWSDSLFVTGCINCLRSSNQAYFANMVEMLQVGCDQKPEPGSTISVSGTIFSTTLMNETSPTPTSTWTSLYNNGPLSLGAEVGIAIGGLCFVLAVAGFCIVCNGRRRRRAFLRKLEMRHKDSGWPHPFVGGIPRGADMNETPLSQKPLRGWDDSPQSATASEPSYARYFSPYSSQFSSPVTGADGPAMMAQQWPQGQQPEYGSPHEQQTTHHIGFPSAAQEKALQDQHEASAATAGVTADPPAHIGVAFGGDEKSMRTQPSNESVQGRENGQSGGNDNNNNNVESYELHEVSSSTEGSSAGGSHIGHSNSFKNRMARENTTPVLQHPGYGRYSPDKMPPPPPRVMHNVTGGFRDADNEENRI